MSCHRQRPTFEGKTVRDSDNAYSGRYSIVPRTQFLLNLEGWYSQGNDLPDFKLSCRYRDLIRCSVFNGHSKHFHSCFNPEGESQEQPWLRCQQSNFAIIYVPDKHGNFLGRAFVSQPYTWEDSSYAERLILDKIYGNSLQQELIIKALKLKGVDCYYSRTDSYL